MVGFNPQPNRRRWLKPLVVLLVGGSIAWWASARETKRMHAVENRAKDICIAMAKNQNLVGTINEDNPIMEEKTIEALRRAIGGREDAELVEVRVVSGDPLGSRVGSSANAATHTAMLHMGSIDLLALRMRCDDPDVRVEVLGYVVPPTN